MIVKLVGGNLDGQTREIGGNLKGLVYDKFDQKQYPRFYRYYYRLVNKELRLFWCGNLEEWRRDKPIERGW